VPEAAHALEPPGQVGGGRVDAGRGAAGALFRVGATEYGPGSDASAGFLTGFHVSARKMDIRPILDPNGTQSKISI
jgi:hypothetical protein